MKDAVLALLVAVQDALSASDLLARDPEWHWIVRGGIRDILEGLDALQEERLRHKVGA
jgi:hypothetical protein